MKKVLFVTYGGGHVNIVIPLIKELLQYGSVKPIIIGLTTATIRLKEHNITYYSLVDFLKGDSKKEAIQIGNEMAAEFHNPKAGIDEEETVSYLGASMYDLIKKYGQKEAQLLFKQQGRKAFLPTLIMEEVLKETEPDLIVTTSGQRAERAAVIAGKKFGIPTLRIMDLFGNTGSLPETDYVAVMNQFAKQCLIERGVDPSKVFVTGQPAFESLFTITKHQQQKFIDELNLKPGQKLVTWISQTLPEREEILEDILNTFKELQEYELIIKLHPSEDGVVHEQILKSYNLPNARIIKQANTQVLLSISDLVITQWSTCGLEAILLGKPLITMNFSKLPDKLPYASSGAATGVYAPGELKQKVGLILSQAQKGTEQRREMLMSPTPVADTIGLIKKLLSEGFREI